jgi:hypothetical protein
MRIIHAQLNHIIAENSSAIYGGEMGDCTLLAANVTFPTCSPERGQIIARINFFHKFTIILFLDRELLDSENISTENFFEYHYEFYSSCFVFLRPSKHILK